MNTNYAAGRQDTLNLRPTADDFRARHDRSTALTPIAITIAGCPYGARSMAHNHFEVIS